MAVWSKATLANKTLEWMGVKPIGQAVSGEHSTFVQEAYESLYDDLQDSDLAPFAIGAVEDWAKWGLVYILAVRVGPRFGKPYPESLEQKGIALLAKGRFGGPRGENPIQSESF